MTKKQGVLICVLLYSISMMLLGAKITAGLFVFHVVVVPLLFKYSKTLRRSIIFANYVVGGGYLVAVLGGGVSLLVHATEGGRAVLFKKLVQWPFFIDYANLNKYGVEGGTNFSLEYDSKVDNCLVVNGMWHILPKSTFEKLKDRFAGDPAQLSIAIDNDLLTSNAPIIFYCHGNSNTRAASHRIKLYKIFQKMEFHVITFDYRGYGDSTSLSPSESGVVEDALLVYDWLISILEKRKKRPPVFVWGHSLGTAIASHLLGNLEELSAKILKRSSPLPMPNGLILEAPFNNIAEEVSKHPLTKLVKWLPYFDNMFVAPFRAANSYENPFCSDEHLTRVRSLPILMLHAKDDSVVPFEVGYKLYKSVLKSRSEGDAPVTLHVYDKMENLGHNWICNAKDLPVVVGDFVRNHR